MFLTANLAWVWLACSGMYLTAIFLFIVKSTKKKPLNYDAVQKDHGSVIFLASSATSVTHSHNRCRGVARRGGGLGWPPFPEFGRSVNPIQTKGQIMPVTLLPAPLVSKYYLQLWVWWVVKFSSFQIWGGYC